MNQVHPKLSWLLHGGAGCRRRFRRGKAANDVKFCACGLGLLEACHTSYDDAWWIIAPDQAARVRIYSSLRGRAGSVDR